MKWGRQKPPSSSSSSSYSSSSIFRVFPISWLLKFKQTSVSSEPDSSISKRKSEEMKARRNRGSNEAGKDQISRKTESRGAKSNVRSSDSLKIEEQISFSEEELTSKIKGLKLKCEKQRSSVYISRRTPKQSTKSRVNSPRIRAIEEIKKVNTKKKKEKSKFSRFAVMKTSFDPHQDFKDSMVEMIVEKGIQRPEELEELLACYLMLNCDEYHDLIIKVFRQVWFKVESTLFSP